MKIKIDQMAVYTASQTNPEVVDETTAEFLYDAALTYKNSAAKVARLSETIKESLERIAAGRLDYYTLSTKAIELEVAAAERDSAEKTFRVLCKVKGIEVE